MEEVWKDIKGYEGKYQASTLGRIRSLNYRKTGKTVIMRPRDSAPYYLINLASHKTYLVHRLIATTFINNPNNLPYINHIDGNKKNNAIDNLEWCTNTQNVHHALYCLDVGNQKKVCQYLIMDGRKSLIAIYKNAKIAAVINKLQAQAIRKCCNGKLPFYAGFFWGHYEDEPTAERMSKDALGIIGRVTEHFNPNP